MRIYTNCKGYHNDIAEVVRLFLGLSQIDFSEEETEAELSVCLTENDGYILADARYMDRHMLYRSDAHNETLLIRKRHEKRAVKIAVFRLLTAFFGTCPPWGSLTGIRPTKLYRDLAMRIGDETTTRMFMEEFDVCEDKTMLAREICAVQYPLIMSADPTHDIDIYIGIPYCRTRCLYCSFRSVAVGKRDVLTPYLEALKKDIAHGAALVERTGRSLRAMYIGGGTPTVLSVSQLDELLDYTLEQYGGFGTEFTVEAGRPDTITREKLLVLKKHGVGRISVNPQTMCDRTLELIGRSHSAEQIREAFFSARDIGFCINMDLIAGLPGESEPDMDDTLRSIEALAPDNLTVHTLALKRSSRLMDDPDRYPLPTAACTENMVELGRRYAGSMKMRPYYMYRQKYMQGNLENVGYARSGQECIYNIDMMEEVVSILAHGAGAMSKRIFDAEKRVERIPNPKDVPSYTNKLPTLFMQKEQLFAD